MTSPTRFGRRLPLPSTIKIKHELLLMTAADALRRALDQDRRSPQERVMIIGDMAEECRVSRDRAQMLIDRFGFGRSALLKAMQSLNERKAAYGVH